MDKGINSVIAGIGVALPPKIISNYDLEKLVETSDHWIVSRTGIKQRRVLKMGDRMRIYPKRLLGKR